jgi:hypothetical protein
VFSSFQCGSEGRQATSAIATRTIILVDSPRHAGPAVARDPDHRPVDARVQLAAVVVVGEEGVQVGQQAHGGRLLQKGRLRGGVGAACDRNGQAHAPLSAIVAVTRLDGGDQLYSSLVDGAAPALQRKGRTLMPC